SHLHAEQAALARSPEGHAGIRVVLQDRRGLVGGQQEARALVRAAVSGTRGERAASNLLCPRLEPPGAGLGLEKIAIGRPWAPARSCLRSRVPGARGARRASWTSCAAPDARLGRTRSDTARGRSRSSAAEPSTTAPPR